MEYAIMGGKSVRGLKAKMKHLDIINRMKKKGRREWEKRKM